MLRAFYLCYICTEDPVNRSLDPATRLYGWRYLSLNHYCCYIHIYVYVGRERERVRAKSVFPTSVNPSFKSGR